MAARVKGKPYTRTRKTNEREKYGWRARRNRVIFERWRAGDSQTALGHDYGLDRSTISRIIARANGA